MTASENSDTGTRLGAAAAARLARYHPGVVVGVLDLRADTRTVAGAGHLYLPGGPAPEGRSVFEIGSITKIFTGLLLAVAVLRGEAALDTPVEELLPHGLRVPRRSGQLITLRHLATHTSGLPRSPRGATAEWRNCNP